MPAPAPAATRAPARVVIPRTAQLVRKVTGENHATGVSVTVRWYRSDPLRRRDPVEWLEIVETDPTGLDRYREAWAYIGRRLPTARTDYRQAVTRVETDLTVTSRYPSLTTIPAGARA